MAIGRREGKISAYYQICGTSAFRGSSERCSFVGLGLLNRKRDQELRAMADFAFHLDPATMIFDDAPCQRQPQARAVSFVV